MQHAYVPGEGLILLLGFVINHQAFHGIVQHADKDKARYIEQMTDINTFFIAEGNRFGDSFL